MSSGLRNFDVVSMAPGNAFVVSRVVVEASVEDPDRAIAEGTQRGMVGVAGGPASVVEGSSTW